MSFQELRLAITGSLFHKAVGLFVLSILSFNLAYWFSIQQVHQEFSDQSKSQVMQRIALDLPTLPIANEWLNKQGDQSAVNQYIERLNLRLKEQGWPLEVIDISTIKPVQNITTVDLETLAAMEQTVYVLFNSEYQGANHGFNVVPTLFAVLLTWLYIYRIVCRRELAPVQNAQADSPLLITIDLPTKVIKNPKTGNETSISNKPLCFYCALIEYCMNNPEVTLNSSKELPEELLLLSQKYFYRLIELGHTIRKRPNFESNLDKTLSEIRAALDEVLGNNVNAREILIPPKAIGEGSRSKVHNFGLTKLEPDVVDIVGK